MIIDIDLKVLQNRIKSNPIGNLLRISSLSLGLICFIFIYNWSEYLLTQPGFNGDTPIFHRVVAYPPGDINNDRFDYISSIHPALKDLIPKDENIINKFRFATADSLLNTEEPGYDRTDYLWFADRDIFKSIKYKFIEGDTSNPFPSYNSAILTESFANKYFNGGQAIGKEISYHSKKFIVTGIIKDVPSYYHFNFKILANYEYLSSLDLSGRILYNFTYLTLKRKIDFRDENIIINHRLESEINRNFPRIWIVPLWQDHCYDASNGRNPKDLYLLNIISLFAVLIILISFVNYLILSVSDFSTRNKEFVIRRMFSNSIIELLKLIFFENFIYLIASLILAFLSLIFIKYTNVITSNFDVFTFKSIKMIAIYVISICTIASLIMFRKIKNKSLAELLKSDESSGIAGDFWRKSILFFEITVSLAFIIYSGGILSQFEFTKDLKYSYDRENIVYSPINGSISINNQNTNVLSVKCMTGGELKHLLIEKHFNGNQLTNNSESNYLVGIIKNQYIPSSIKYLEDKIKESGQKQKLQFVDTSLQAAIESENEISRTYALILTLSFINCFIGLICLLKFILLKRRKELTIRKVFGARKIDLELLICKEISGVAVFSVFSAWVVAFLHQSTFFHSFIDRTSPKLIEYIVPSSIIIFGLYAVTILQVYLDLRRTPIKAIRS